MNNKLENKILEDWLKSARRKVRVNDDKTSAFISCGYDTTIECVWDAWTAPRSLAERINGRYKISLQVNLKLYQGWSIFMG